MFIKLATTAAAAALFVSGLVTATSASAATVAPLPDGVTLSTLQQQPGVWGSVLSAAIKETAPGHNIVRIQVQQDWMTSDNYSYDPAEYLKVLESGVKTARHLGLTVVLNDQTEENYVAGDNDPMPTTATWAFWKLVAGAFKNQPGVIFDLFNEPREHPTWAAWHTSMQNLYDSVRGYGARNTIWIEPPVSTTSLWPMPLVKGYGIVYSFHHPNGPFNWATWAKNLSRHIPLVDGELDAAQATKPYLTFLREHHIGVTIWTVPARG
jgi:hypothetical protein